MRSNDGTLLARLGFSDGDKKDPKHDLACSYVRENAERVVDSMPEQFSWLSKPGRVTASCEVPLSKGEGRYKSTIGFLDVLVSWQEAWTGDDGVMRWGSSKPLLGVEVKTGPVSSGDLLRQVRLYQEHAQQYYVLPFLVVVTFEPSAQLVEELRAHDIKVMRLGAKFDDWCRARHAVSGEVGEL